MYFECHVPVMNGEVVLSGLLFVAVGAFMFRKSRRGMTVVLRERGVDPAELSEEGYDQAESRLRLFGGLVTLIGLLLVVGGLIW